MLVTDVENDNTDNDDKTSEVPLKTLMPIKVILRNIEDNDETSEVFSENSEILHSDSWNVLLESNGSDINYKIDTGAQVLQKKNEFVKLHIGDQN